ncbi:MAG: hypothetical protein QGI46_12135 [Planctomycetota bacterium]|nr:hypothetical protein [Planctomycetota bacterium]
MVPTAPQAPRGLDSAVTLRGSLRPPPSKSLVLRTVVCGTLCDEPLTIEGVWGGGDVDAALALLSALGVEHARSGEDLLVRGARRDGRPTWPMARAVDVGESGTLARMATALLALCGDPRRPVTVGGRGSLARRRSPALLRALERAGARIDRTRGDGWPLTVHSAPGEADLALEAPESSQEASALLLALAGRERTGILEVHGELPSRPYLEMTCAVLASLGVSIERVRSGSRERFTLAGPPRPPVGPVTIEADASAAAVALAAGCLSGGGVRTEGVGARSLQGDAAVVGHLAAFGCAAGAGDDHLWAEGRPSRGAVCDLAGEPDLAPVLAAVAAGAAAAGHSSRLEGLGTLDGKESPRLEWLVGALRLLGFEVGAGETWLEVAGARSEAKLAAGELDPAGDHRMAFAGALLGLVVPGTRVRDPSCVHKSWPGFWGDLARLADLDR